MWPGGSQGQHLRAGPGPVASQALRRRAWPVVATSALQLLVVFVFLEYQCVAPLSSQRHFGSFLRGFITTGFISRLVFSVHLELWPPDSSGNFL